MANEFVAKNGLISQNNTTVSGSLNVSGLARITTTLPTPLLVERTGSSSNVNIQFKNDAGNVFIGQRPFSSFGIGSIENLALASQFTVFTNTGNVVIQNGNTATDNGYRLQVNGSGSLSGSLYSNGFSNFTATVSGSALANNLSSSIMQ